MLYTAQYRYSGQDRLDITVKGDDPIGKIYAPTWDMVKGVKAGTMSEEEYINKYYDLLIVRAGTNTVDMHHLVETVKLMDITVVCFCPAGTFCHRHLMVTFFQHNWSILYGGERG
jgi:hypothetical protein